MGHNHSFVLQSPPATTNHHRTPQMAAKHFDFSSALPSHLQSKDGSVPTTDALQNKVFGLYFSAHWCPPCRGFTPKLAETYNTLKAAGKNFEIVFVSRCRSRQTIL